MPANRGELAGPWHQKPDYRREWNLQTCVDEQPVDHYDETAVADCLQENGDFDAYLFTPGVDIGELALESAREIIRNRNELHDQRVAAATRKAATLSTHHTAHETNNVVTLKTFSVPSVRNLASGERIPGTPQEVVKVRSFG